MAHSRATYGAANELRRFHVTEIRASKPKDDDEASTEIEIEGYASITGEPYTMNDFMGEFQETIERGAFTKTLQEKDDVRLLLNHDGIPLARTSSGTMTLAEDKTGLKVEATIDNRSSVANDVFVAIERGDLDEMSFAFNVTRQEWNEDFSERWIKEVKLFDVSVVTYPANPATSVKLRGVDFLLNNLSDSDVKEIIDRYTVRTKAAEAAFPVPELLALRRRQMAMADLR